MKFCPICGKELLEGKCPAGCDLSKVMTAPEKKETVPVGKTEGQGGDGDGGIITEKQLKEMVSAAAKETVDITIREVIDPLKAQMKTTENKLIARMDSVPDYLGRHKVPKEDCEKFFKILGALADGDRAQAKLISGISDASGRLLIPTTIAGVVQYIAPVYGVMRAESTMWPMATDKENVPKWIVEMPDSWEGEGNLIHGWDDDPFGQTQLTTQRHSVIVPLTRQMLSYPRVKVMNVVVEKMGESLAYGAEKVGFKGLRNKENNGWSIPGIVNTFGVAAEVTSGAFTTLTGVNMDALIAAVKGRALNGAAFFMNHAVLFNVVANLKDGDGRYIYEPAREGRPSQWRGFPIKWTDALKASPGVDTPFIVFGNLAYMLFGTSEQMYAETAREATITVKIGETTKDYNLFQQGIQAVKVEEEVDLKVSFASAFAVVKTSPNT